MKKVASIIIGIGILELLLWWLTGTGMINFVWALVLLVILSGGVMMMIEAVIEIPFRRSRDDARMMKIWLVALAILLIGHLWMCRQMAPLRSAFWAMSGWSIPFRQAHSIAQSPYDVVKARDKLAHSRGFLTIAEWWLHDDDSMPTCWEVYVWIPFYSIGHHKPNDDT